MRVGKGVGQGGEQFGRDGGAVGRGVGTVGCTGDVILSHVLHVCGPVLHIHVYVQYCHKCGIADTWIHGYFCIAHTAVLHILQKISIAKVKNESRVHARLRVCE